MPNTLVKRVTFYLLSPILTILLILVLSVLALAEIQPQAALAGKNVLVLHAWEANLPMSTETNKALSRVFSSGGIPALNQSFECLDLRRNSGPEYKKLLVEKMRLQYGHRKPDLIIAVNPIAMRFATDDCRDVFADIPILALMLPTGFQVPKTSRRVISHFPSLDIVRTLDIALKLVPHAKRVYVASGSYETDIAAENQVRRVSKKWEGRLQFLYLSSMPFEDMLAAVSKASPDSIVLALGFARDVSGKLLTTPTAIRRLSQVSAAPIFGIVDVALGYGIVGGFLSSYEFIGTKAGELALDILRGARTPENIPAVLDVPSVPMFDWRELKRWKLSETALPKGSIVINRESTFWDFKYYILAGVAVLLAQTLLLIGLLIQRQRKIRAEASLRQRTEELDQFFNVTLDLLCIANTDGYFLRLNPAWERTLGHTREELMAKRFLEFVHPDDLESTLKAISTLASQQKIFLFENRYRCKDGTYRWLQWSSAPAGNLIYAAGRDVTGRKQAEQALEERLRFEGLVSDISAKFVNIPHDRVDSEIEHGLREILEFFQVDRCALLQVLQDKSSWQITHVTAQESVPPVPQGTELPASINPWAYEKLTEKREVLSFSRLDDLPAEANVDRQTWIEWGIRSNLNIPIILGGPVVHVFAINSVKSERVWPEEFIPRLRLLGEILVNALERRQIRLQIEERLQFERLISNLSAGFVNLPSDKFESQINRELRSITEFFDVGRCSIELFSQDETQLVRTFEYHSAETEPSPESISKEQMPWYIEQLIQGKPVVMSRVEDLPPEAEKERQLCLAKGIKSLLAVPMLSGNKNLGSCALVSTHAERVWPEELVKRFRLISEVFTNALQHKRAEVEVARARAELLHVERSLRLNEMTASLAHELNQPLAAILSNAQAALRFLQSDKVNLDEFREILHDIIHDDQRAGNVIRSLRSMMKREEVDRNPIILNNVLNEVIEIFHTESISRNVHVETEFDGLLPTVLGDKVQLQQVVLNLILNAADAMSHNPPEYRQIILRTELKGDRIRVTVRDFGSGIDKENMERIFEPFFTTKGAGLGMGLNICRTIVEAHEGRIWAENNPDRGATFFFELPVISSQ